MGTKLVDARSTAVQYGTTLDLYGLRVNSSVRCTLWPWVRCTLQERGRRQPAHGLLAMVYHGLHVSYTPYDIVVCSPQNEFSGIRGSPVVVVHISIPYCSTCTISYTWSPWTVLPQNIIIINISFTPCIPILAAVTRILAPA